MQMCASCRTVTHSSHDGLRELVKQDFSVPLHVQDGFQMRVNSDTVSELFTQIIIYYCYNIGHTGTIQRI